MLPDAAHWTQVHKHSWSENTESYVSTAAQLLILLFSVMQARDHSGSFFLFLNTGVVTLVGILLRHHLYFALRSVGVVSVSFTGHCCCSFFANSFSSVSALRAWHRRDLTVVVTVSRLVTVIPPVDHHVPASSPAESWALFPGSELVPSSHLAFKELVLRPDLHCRVQGTQIRSSFTPTRQSGQPVDV